MHHKVGKACIPMSCRQLAWECSWQEITNFYARESIFLKKKKGQQQQHNTFCDAILGIWRCLPYIVAFNARGLMRPVLLTFCKIWCHPFKVKSHGEQAKHWCTPYCLNFLLTEKKIPYACDCWLICSVYHDTKWTKPTFAIWCLMNCLQNS